MSKDRWLAIAPPLASLVFAFVVSSVVLAVSGANPFVAFGNVIEYGVRLNTLVETINWSTPLYLSGASGSAIHSSASRREQSPERAMYRFRRIPSVAALRPATGSLRRPGDGASLDDSSARRAFRARRAVRAEADPPRRGASRPFPSRLGGFMPLPPVARRRPGHRPPTP